MKTLENLMRLREEPCTPFKNAYVALIMRIEDFYLTNSNWRNRILNELSIWDSEAKNKVIADVVELIKHENPDFNEEILFELLK